MADRLAAVRHRTPGQGEPDRRWRRCMPGLRRGAGTPRPDQAQVLKEWVVSWHERHPRPGQGQLRCHRICAATLALAAGADLKTVQDQLGHSSIVLTADTYIARLMPPQSIGGRW